MIGIYRMLLRLYPAEFRRAYADDMAEAFAEDLEAARRKGSGGVLRFWIFIVGDLLASAGRLRGRHLVSVCRRLAGRDVPRLPHRAKRTEMDTMLHDLRYGLRQFLRRPGFAAVAVVSLALAIGGNSLIYGIVDGFVLRLFDYPDPDRLVTVGVTFPKLSSETTYVETLSPAEYADIRAARAFLSTAAFDLGNRNLSGGDVPERVFTALLLDDPFPVRPKVFTSMEAGGDAWNQLFLLVRADRPAAALLPDIRQAIGSIDPQQPVYAIQTLDEALAMTSFQQRIAAVLLVVFAAIALVLAAIGIYGVMSYSVSARTQELGVRLAIGASRGAVMWLVMKQVLVLAGIGLAAGVAMLIAVGRGLEGLLFGIRPGDPGTIAIVTLLLAVVALLAAWVPASRASGVDPIQALRYE